MERFNFGKIFFIIFVFVIVVLFFGRDIIGMYSHVDDMRFNVNNLQYTKKEFYKLESSEQKALIEDISNTCVQKHYADNVSCTDTSYWLASSLEKNGVDSDLVIEWMPFCIEACETRARPKVIVLEKETSAKKRQEKTSQYGGATKWFWED